MERWRCQAPQLAGRFFIVFATKENMVFKTLISFAFLHFLTNQTDGKASAFNSWAYKMLNHCGYHVN